MSDHLHGNTFLLTTDRLRSRLPRPRDDRSFRSPRHAVTQPRSGPVPSPLERARVASECLNVVVLPALRHGARTAAGPPRIQSQTGRTAGQIVRRCGVDQVYFCGGCTHRLFGFAGNQASPAHVTPVTDLVLLPASLERETCSSLLCSSVCSPCPSPLPEPYCLEISPGSTARHRMQLLSEAVWRRRPGPASGGRSYSSRNDATGYGPVFEEQPLDLIYPEESPEAKISMNCRARANPPATYKWRLNNWESGLNNWESGCLLFQHGGGEPGDHQPREGQALWAYVCVATNVYGTVFSKEAIVKFGYLDFFSTEERDAVHVKEGQGAVLLCAPPPHYPDDLSFRWMLNEFPIFIPLDKRRFVSQKTGNLYISKVEAEDSGNYSCFVSSPSIAKSVFSQFIPWYTLALQPGAEVPADIRVKFSDTYALLNQNVTLECFALGNPIPEIRWRKVDGELPTNIEVSMAGALLHIFNVQVEDEGRVECGSVWLIGRAWFCVAHVVLSVPEWAVHINNTEKDIGSDLTLSCQANAKPWTYIRWLKNGYSYGKGDLRFTSLTFEDSGMYQCIAENRHGIIYANAELRVIACAPTFEYAPVRKALLGARKGRVVIECRPKAAPKAKITWSKGTELLSNSSRVRIWDDGSLEILNVTKMDEGRYTCFAENDRGKANSTGTLSITGESTFTTSVPFSCLVLYVEECYMQCAASHDPSLDITFIWAVDTHVIDFDRETEHYQSIMSDDSSGELWISNTQLKHAGRYTCTAQTIVDNVTVSADLMVRGPPGPPGGLRVEDFKDKMARLLWSRGTDNHSPISRYTIQFRDSFSLDQEEWKNAITSPPVVEGNAEMANVVELTPWTEYEFRIIATNALGVGEPSVPCPKIRTWEAAPVVAPSDIGGGGGTSRELTITWTPVPPQYYYGRKFGYVVAFKPHDYTDWRRETVADPEARRFVYKDSSILPATEFQVKVKAYNSQGEGPYSLTAVIYSSQDVPTEAPGDVVARTLTATEALVWWLPVLCDSVVGSVVKYWRKYFDNEAAANRVLVPASENQTRLENMLPDSHYMVEVRAYNDAGFGPPADIYEMYTRKAPPSRPPKLTKTWGILGTSVNIAWDHVEPWINESMIEGYKVLVRKEGHTNGTLYTTGSHYIDLPRPKRGEFVVEVRARSEGGDGPIAAVRVSARGLLGAESVGVLALLLVALCSLSL
ncbi:hypothetical protein AAFF_G00266980 [Aldrovandia affinis]|uniref:Contactin-1 n=1 Tax=Aldrovandia affinis TaxID=143900 RepID=A0AAD7RB78_9TELE|nr:hypothetical protein AAFF_G00266980 [Aldrovandia affinis]